MPKIHSMEGCISENNKTFLKRPMARHENIDEFHRQWKNCKNSDSTAEKLLGVS